MDNFIKLRVLGITYSQIQSGAYALVLAEEVGKRRVPIVIGPAEAQSIAMQLEKVKAPRPLTHDLFVDFAGAYGIEMKEVLIYKYEEGVFSSEILFENEAGVQRRIDSRTSDAIALSLRKNSPIYMREEILDLAGIEFDKEGQERDELKGGATLGDLQAQKQSLLDLMADAVKQEHYEEAGVLKDQIAELEGLIKEEQTTFIKTESPQQNTIDGMQEQKK